MPHSDRTPLRELRRNAIAGAAVLIVVGFGALAVMAAMDWFAMIQKGS
jgi:hypothetical protein